MTVALGPHHDELVDVRATGVYLEWQSARGLRCLLCRDAVHVFQHHAGTLWLRHTRRREQHCTGATGPETYEHALLKFWVRDRLTELEYDASCEPHLDGSVPDVHAVRGDRTLAIEVQLQPLTEQQARKRTERLQERQCEVLWLTWHCSWVTRLPAVSLHRLSPAPLERADGGHAHPVYIVREGVLTCDPDQDGKLEGGRKRLALGEFLDRFADAGDVEWGWLRDDHDGDDEHGWALTGDWRQHVQWQQRRLDQLQLQLAAEQRARHELAEQRRDLVRQSAVLRTELTQAHTDLEAQAASGESDQQRRQVLAEQRDDATAAAAVWEGRFRDLQEAVSSSFWGRWALKRLDRT